MVIGPPSDAVLTRYLLGEADLEDEERFDELSVSDAAFAERLRAIEHDLADAYARGELSPSDRERWEARYLGSQHGRDDLALAQALVARERGGSKDPPYDSKSAGPPHGSKSAGPSHDSKYVGRVLRPGGLSAWWPLAAAAVLVLAIAGGYRVLHRAEAPATVARQAPVATPAPAAPPAARRVVALTLVPSFRGPGEPPTLTISPGTTDATLTLTLEPDDAPQYDVALRDLSTNGVAWRADRVAAGGTDPDRAIVVSVPASTFHTRRYLINVMRSGTPEILASYPLVVVVQ